MGVESTENQPPITKEFLDEILKHKITTFKIGTGSNPGDNYTSILFSIEVKLKDDPKPVHLLYKTFPFHPTRQKLLSETNLFLKEYLVYSTFVPKLISFQTDFLENDKILIPAIPKLVGGAARDYLIGEVNSDVDPFLDNFLLMVDERKNGFQMANKLESLGYHHAKLVLDELAKFNALSYGYKIHEKLPNLRTLFPFLNGSIFTDESQEPVVSTMFQTNIKLITEVLQGFFKKKPELADTLKPFEEYGACMKILRKFLQADGVDEEEVENLQRVKRYTDPPLKDQWITVGHGDFWTNNFLFKKDDMGKITSTILVDLQMTRECCITADLAYFFYTSTDTSFRSKYLDEMLEHYHQQFVHYCKTLKVEPFKDFTLENFKRKFHRSKLLGFTFSTLVVPIILVKPETTIDLDAVEHEEVEGEDKLASIFQKSNRDEEDLKSLRERFSAAVQELYEEGVL